MSEPRLSVIAPTIDNYATVAPVLEAVRAQLIAQFIEFIVVFPESGNDCLLPGAGQGFHSIRTVTCPMPTRGHGAAAGVRAATAPVVVMVEDHAFPHAGWAEALLKGHEAGYGAVGPAIENANPETVVSWADLLTGYGPLIPPLDNAEVRHLAGHNCSYNKVLLLKHFDADLERLLNVEVVMHEQMSALGLKLYLAGEARIRHLNFDTMRRWLRGQVLHGRLHAATRSRDWGLGQKLRFLMGAPLMPLVRTRRSLRLPAAKHLERKLSLMAALLCGSAVSVIGEIWGILYGAGSSAERLLPLEFHRAQSNAQTLRRA